MKALITFFSFLIIGLVYGQKNNEVIVISGEGIVINKDTFLLGINPKSLLLKIDTINHNVSIRNSFGHSDGVKIFTDSLTGKTIAKDVYWSTFYCKINIKDLSINFMFEGDDTKSNLALVKIIIEYPCVATTTKGLKTGVNYTDIFEKYNEKEGSYNCAENGFYYCYYNYGISFKVKPYKENPNPEMYEKIVGFEVFEKQKR